MEHSAGQDSNGALWLARLGPAALLCLVAVSQLIKVHTQHVSPWKHGGFGMFATVDAHSDRGLMVTAVDTAGKSYPLLIPYSELDRPRGKSGDLEKRNLWWWLDNDTIRELAQKFDQVRYQQFARMILEQGYVTELGPATIQALSAFPYFSDGSKPGVIVPGAKFLPTMFYKVRTPLEAAQMGITTEQKRPLASTSVQLFRRRFSSESGELKWEELSPRVTVSN